MSVAKKKAVIYNSKYLNNTETFVYNQTRGLFPYFDVTFLTQKTLNLDLFPMENIICEPFGRSEKIAKFVNPYSLPSGYKNRIRSTLKKIDPDIIHIHFGVNAARLAPVLGELDIPFLVTFHGTDASKKLKDFRYRRLLRRHINKHNHICVSKAIRANIEAIGVDSSDDNLHYIGVDSDRFSYVNRTPLHNKISNSEPIEFIQVARFTEKKGHTQTLHTFHQLLGTLEKPDLARLTFIGNGPLLENMKKLVSSLSMDSHVQFLGSLEQDEIIERLQRADIFLQHSITSRQGDKEGLPIGIMEAMSTGLPVVSTNHSGIPELITNGVNGFLVDEKDTGGYLEAMLGAIKLSDTAISENARKSILDNFNLGSQNKLLALALERAIEAHRGSTNTI